MFCRRCGQELRPGAKFCTKCGMQVPEGMPSAQPGNQVPTGQTPPVQGGSQASPVQPGKQAPTGQTPSVQPGNQIPTGQIPPVQGGSQASPVQLGKQAPTGQTPPVQPGNQIPTGQIPPVQGGSQTPPIQGGGQIPPTHVGGQVPLGQMPPGGQNPPNGPKKKKTGLIIGLVCVIILAIAIAAAVGVVFYFRNQQNVSDNEKFVRRDSEIQTDKMLENTEDGDTQEDAPIEQESEETETTDVATEATETESEEAKPEKPKSHDYQIVVGDVTWTEAFQAAQNIPGGHLLNINSEKEWKKIIKKIEDEDMEGYVFWIGATRRGNSRDYLWVDASGNTVGEPMNDSEHWLAGEPSFYDSEFGVEERYVNLFYSSTEERWVCNDTADDVISLLSSYSGRVAYIVEIEYD